ncbi:MAG: hypothetical protein ABJA70_19935 [Chryseolinea sp.]
MDIQQEKMLSEECYRRLIAEIEEKYGSQACDLEPLHALLYYVSEDDVRSCLKAEWCNEFMEHLQKKYRGTN